LLSLEVVKRQPNLAQKTVAQILELACTHDTASQHTPLSTYRVPALLVVIMTKVCAVHVCVQYLCGRTWGKVLPTQKQAVSKPTQPLCKHCTPCADTDPAYLPQQLVTCSAAKRPVTQQETLCVQGVVDATHLQHLAHNVSVDESQASLRHQPHNPAHDAQHKALHTRAVQCHNVCGSTREQRARSYTNQQMCKPGAKLNLTAGTALSLNANTTQHAPSISSFIFSCRCCTSGCSCCTIAVAQLLPGSSSSTCAAAEAFLHACVHPRSTA
jgi:hypothetical protein